ncbi:Alpha/Beta hydrolase protein [Phaeosphaeriaceae sp. PMI808]|nr:Alpha/Beta hydrolase protein [Phaeosphaeriaceae sp. PMI808]
MSEQYGLGDPLFDPAEAKIDIVFIHGLGGDRARTWTWEGDGRKHFWPKDLLPQACPTARILSFSYNAEFAHFFPFYGPKFMLEQLTINDYSTALFQSLIGLHRPVIFVCHSLGGLVCANALSRYYGTDLAGANLVEKTIGVMFLGTPFEGSSKAKWAGRALKKFLKARDRSETGQFIKVTCFFEQYTMYKARKKIGIIIPKELASNYVDIYKFKDEDREGYKNILQRRREGSTTKSQV